MFFKIFSSLALAQLAVAQYGYGGGSSTPTPTSALAPAPSAPPNTNGHININVFPDGKYVFDPQNITADIGTLVTFYIPNSQFSHSITQSSFANPCTYLQANGSNPAGFDSGLQTAQTFTLNVTSNSPIWFHCKQLLHCGMGMVGSINAPPNGTNTHEAFVAAAMAIGQKEVTETGGGPVLTGVGAVATGAPTSASTTGGSTDSSGSSGASKIVAKGGLYLVAAGVFMSLI